MLSYSTYLGSSLADGAFGIAADNSGNAYVVGSTFSTNFPVTTGAFQSMNNEPSNLDVYKRQGKYLSYSFELSESSQPPSEVFCPLRTAVGCVAL